MTGCCLKKNGRYERSILLLIGQTNVRIFVSRRVSGRGWARGGPRCRRWQSNETVAPHKKIKKRVFRYQHCQCCLLLGGNTQQASRTELGASRPAFLITFYFYVSKIVCRWLRRATCCSMPSPPDDQKAQVFCFVSRASDDSKVRRPPKTPPVFLSTGCRWIKTISDNNKNRPTQPSLSRYIP